MAKQASWVILVQFPFPFIETDVLVAGTHHLPLFVAEGTRRFGAHEFVGNNLG